MPLALNGDAGDQPGMGSTFFRRVAKHFANEMAVVTPNGELLSHYPEEGMKKWRALPEGSRRKLEDLGEFDSSFLPSPPNRGLILEVFSRGLQRSNGGRLHIYKTKVARSLEPGRDHLWMTAEEAGSLLPRSLKAGAKQSVAGPLVDRICRRYLIDLVRVGGNGGPRRLEEVIEQKIDVIVDAVAEKEIRVKLEGSARLSTGDVGSGAQKDAPKIDNYVLQGEAAFDRETGHFSKFILIAYSETGHFDEIHKKVLPLGVAFVLSSNRLSGGLTAPPSSYSDLYFSSKGRPPGR